MRPIVILLIVIVVLIILLSINFMRWKKSALRVMDDGEVMETAKGKIHYKLTGEGPVLFFMHGGPGGIDQAFLLNELVKAGYSMLAVSRPGYLR
ncbi:MAG: hypothetical protein KAS63_09885, partial [Candidatus Heimdallarchaeota archaeon]|nr:hypothetical protein [Candidatus Heimdallarchaeota archaeon]MCK4955661.1 hypothetical protein [Candidatus Heimdallarchaeota archaeon]